MIETYCCPFELSYIIRKLVGFGVLEKRDYNLCGVGDCIIRINDFRYTPSIEFEGCSLYDLIVNNYDILVGNGVSRELIDYVLERLHHSI